MNDVPEHNGLLFKIDDVYDLSAELEFMQDRTH